MKLFSSLRGVTLVALTLLFLLIHIVAFASRADLTVPLYGTMPWLDIPAHLLFAAGLALLVYPYVIFRYAGPLLIFILVMLAGVGWECVEYGYDFFYAASRDLSFANHGVVDTLKDVLNNGLGVVGVLCVPRTLWFMRVFKLG